MANINFSNPINLLQEVDDITEILTVRFPYAVKCEINLNRRTATVPRLELKLNGNRPIAAGWTAKISILQGIDRRYTLGDAIVLPIIVPKIIVPVGGGTATISRDLAKSEDEWSLEYYIVDPAQKSELLYRSPSVEFV